MTTTKKIKKKSGYHHGDLRAQLVEASRVLVEQKGPDDFSVSEAARIAGVSTAAPYRHFADKGELLLAVSEMGAKRHLAQMQAAVEKLPKGDLGRIKALGRVYVSLARNEPGLFRLKFSHRLSAEQQRQTLEEGGTSPLDFVEQEVADFLGRKEIDDDVRKRAFLLWTFVHGLSMLLIDGKVTFSDLDVDVEEMLTEISERVMR